MRKLLMIVYNFPPLSTSGMFRSLQFARYLPQHGWMPVVLTIRTSTVHSPGPLDAEPLRILSPEVVVERARVLEPLQMALGLRNHLRQTVSQPLGGGNGKPEAKSAGHGPGWRDWVTDLFSLPDRQAGWILPAARKAAELIDREGIDAIYSSSPPASSHLAALLASRYSGRPWVADFRDPWVSNQFLTERQTTYLDPVDSWLEKRVIEGAAGVIANTDELRDDFQSRYPSLADKFSTLTNGFDGEEIMPVPHESSSVKRPIRLTHAGTIYGQRDATPILRGMESLYKKGLMKKGDMELNLLGVMEGGSSFPDRLASSPVADMVRISPPVPRQEALRQLVNSDLLLLIQAGTTLQIPRKLFEYLSIGRPIFALVTPGATENLIRSESLGRIADPDDEEEIERILLDALRGKGVPAPSLPERFDFRNLTGELTAVLNKALS